MEKAEAELEAGFEAINKMRLVAAKAVKAAQVAAKKEAGEFEEEDAEVGEGDWQRATKESLEAALEEAKEAHTHASSYVIGASIVQRKRGQSFLIRPPPPPLFFSVKV